MSRRLEKNWKWIRAQYETGLPIRKIAELYSDHFPGESVSHQNISAYARRHDWSRDKLVKDYRAETQRKVMEKTAMQAPQGRGVKRPDDEKSLVVYEGEVVAMNSERASEVEFKHRYAGNRTLEAALEVLDEIQCNSVIDVAVRDGNVSTVAMTPAARAKALKDLMYAIDKAVTIERKSWNMDKNDGAPGGAGAVIQVNINVPEPKPLPERFR